MWTESLQFSLFCDKVIEVTGEVRRKINCFYNQDPKIEASGFFKPTIWLCEPENNLRTRYIHKTTQTKPFTEDGFQYSKACQLENVASTSLSA